MNSDIDASYALAEQYPSQIHLIRYEDLSLDPRKHTRALYRFLQLPILGRIKSYVDSHTHADVAGRHSTKHDSKSHVFKWRHQIPWNFMLNIQSKCTEPMSKLGYKKITTQEQLGLNDSLLVKTDQELWNYGVEGEGTW